MSANATISVSELSDTNYTNFDDRVIDMFATHSSQFAKKLQEDGEAGIDKIERLTSMSVYSIGCDVSEIVESPDGSDSPESSNKQGRYLTIATLSFSGFVIMAVSMMFLSSTRKRHNASIDDESSESKSSSFDDGINDVSFPSRRRRHCDWIRTP